MYVQSSTLLLADVFENFRNLYHKRYKLHPKKILQAPALAWQDKIKVKLDLIIDVDMLLMIEKGISRGICQSIWRYAKANNKNMKDYDKKKKSSNIQCLDVNNIYEWAISQNLPVNNFEWIEDPSQFNEDFIKTITMKLMKDIFLNLTFYILKNYMNFVMIYHFSQKEWKLKKWKSL